ncbi:uncharacterized protein Z520_04378 [Fonsecaea multimorphosa CBS 102226]|uniref:Tautomerase cis-CaaD-like domain-containing protein n=1 Tax=Fonsecaea multimorphosa CBS 102226 TaxID=1442371 RepID=A0A0D2K1K5_9EURO|nr:uncharacterized protein Z520_04378 [Fonsecaea multimorphosa CBS 102226]KIX99742.1 hypothetical protein Z520_04378 [Fonsecaea multimorphosa CBS 102226]OAL26790.1 hypothetical protein AYO22_04143 [Fonsecaea multimorphosa]
MPLWRIFSHPSIFTASQREGISKAITDLYVSRGLPPFYVVVIFIDVDEKGFFVGGESKNNFVRIVVEQIARAMVSPETEEGRKTRKAWMDRINGLLKPYIIDRAELEWELHIAETPRDLWRTQGLDPPPANSDVEKLWLEKNKAIPYQ